MRECGIGFQYGWENSWNVYNFTTISGAPEFKGEVSVESGGVLLPTNDGGNRLGSVMTYIGASGLAGSTLMVQARTGGFTKNGSPVIDVEAVLRLNGTNVKDVMRQQLPFHQLTDVEKLKQHGFRVATFIDGEVVPGTVKEYTPETIQAAYTESIKWVTF